MVRWAFTTVTDRISESSPCKTATKTTTNMQLELTACDVCLQANLFTLNCSAHMLALLQDVMEAPGGSATGLLLSTNSPRMKHRCCMSSQMRMLLCCRHLAQGSGMQRPRVTGSLLYLLVPLPSQLQLPMPLHCCWLCWCLCQCQCLCLLPLPLHLQLYYACCLLPAASKFCQYPLPLACCLCWSLVPFCQVSRQLTRVAALLMPVQGQT